MDVRVIVVNWNSGERLRACVQSVADADRSGLAVEIVVVDNASSDGSVDIPLSGEVPVVVRANERNEGFARACNQGADGAEARHLLFLNPDARLGRDALKAAVSFLDSPDGAAYGAAGVQLVDEDGEVQRCCARHPSATEMVATVVGLDRFLGGLVRGLRLSEFDHESDRDVPHVMGAFLLIRRRVFEELGGFDERFFLYLEDLDLTERLEEAGWRTRFLAGARTVHEGGGVSQQVKGRRLAYVLDSRMRYADKHFGLLGRAAVRAASLGVEPWLRAGLAVARGRPKDAVETGEGYALFLARRVLGDRVFRRGRDR